MKLTTKQRNALPSSAFAIPSERKYPVEDAAHARNALARASQYGSAGVIKKVVTTTHKKFPEIKIEHHKRG